MANKNTLDKIRKDIERLEGKVDEVLDVVAEPVPADEIRHEVSDVIRRLIPRETDLVKVVGKVLRSTDTTGPLRGTSDVVEFIVTDEHGFAHGVKVAVYTGSTIDTDASRRRPKIWNKASRRHRKPESGRPTRQSFPAGFILHDAEVSRGSRL